MDASMVCDINVFDHHVVSAVGGFLGGISMLAYMQPANFADAIRRVLISTLAGFFLAESAGEKLFDTHSTEAVMATAFVIGFLAWSILGSTAKFFENRQGQDIIDVLKSVNEVRTPSSPRAETKRPEK